MVKYHIRHGIFTLLIALPKPVQMEFIPSPNPIFVTVSVNKLIIL
ncbi:hypothetical protein [Spiroplasma endosymbiont of Polydrusus formosus]